MKVGTLDVDSLSQLLKTIEDHTQKWPSVWYRGVRSEHQLVPKIFRKTTPDPQESYPLKMYRIRAEPYLDKSVLSDPVRLICHAQHYNVETRLLDWTDSVLLALYFAYESREEIARSIWLLNPTKLNELSCESTNILLPNDARVAYLCGIALGENASEEMGSLAFYPFFIDKRMEAQRSCFTISGTRKLALDVEIPADTENALLQIRLGKGVQDDFDRLDMRRTLAFPALGPLVDDINDERRRLLET